MFKRAMLEKMQLVGEITELAIATADEVLKQLMQFDQRLILYVSIVFTHPALKREDRLGKDPFAFRAIDFIM